MEQQRYFPQMAATNGVIWIERGEAGANSYPVAPGYSVPLFDKDEQRFFIKSVDISGMPMPLREFKYEEVVKKQPTETFDDSKYVTRDDFSNLENDILTKVDEMMQKYLSNKKNPKDKGD